MIEVSVKISVGKKEIVLTNDEAEKLYAELKKVYDKTAPVVIRNFPWDWHKHVDPYIGSGKPYVSWCVKESTNG